jgi:hypothetical protein
MEYDLLHQRDKAVSAYKAVVGQGESSQATEAKRYLKSPYEGGDA